VPDGVGLADKLTDMVGVDELATDELTEAEKLGLDVREAVSASEDDALPVSVAELDEELETLASIEDEKVGVIVEVIVVELVGAMLPAELLVQDTLAAREADRLAVEDGETVAA
jgi:hypothetical protein